MKQLSIALILAFATTACAVDPSEQPEQPETTEAEASLVHTPDLATENADFTRHFDFELQATEATSCTKRLVSKTTQVDNSQCRHRTVYEWWWPCYGEYSYTYSAWAAGC